MAIKWVSLAQYSKDTGLDKRTIKEKIDQGELIAVHVGETGRHIRIKVEDNAEVEDLKRAYEELDRKLSAMCRHFGVGV